MNSSTSIGNSIDSYIIIGIDIDNSMKDIYNWEKIQPGIFELHPPGLIA